MKVKNRNVQPNAQYLNTRFSSIGLARALSCRDDPSLVANHFRATKIRFQLIIECNLHENQSNQCITSDTISWN